MVLNTVHKQKSFAITLVIMSLIVLALLIMKLTNAIIPSEEEDGIAITFGTDNMGMGEINPPKPTEQTVATEEPTEETPKTETTPTEQPVLTQNDEEETVVIPKEEVKKKKETPKETKPTAKKPQKPAASTTDALSSVLNASVKNPHSGNGSGSQGDDNVSGYKGDPKGNPYASSFFGDSSDGSGSGSGKSWGLNGRRYISGEKIFQDCNESGLVIVQIEVDRSGKVVRAKAGEKGTTNKAPCLLDAARKSAMTYRFNADEKAPQTQIGFLSIRFKLGE
jgi:putative uncharacterized protein (fragment)